MQLEKVLPSIEQLIEAPASPESVKVALPLVVRLFGPLVIAGAAKGHGPTIQVTFVAGLALPATSICLTHA
jgi:catalase (peroxidase I)